MSFFRSLRASTITHSSPTQMELSVAEVSVQVFALEERKDLASTGHPEVDPKTYDTSALFISKALRLGPHLQGGLNCAS